MVSTKKKMGFWLQTVAFKLFLGGYRYLPLWYGYFCANILGLLGYKLIKRRREIAIQNIGYAFPEKTLVEKQRIARQAFISIVKNFVEMFQMRRLLKQHRIVVDNREVIDEALARGKGVIAAMLHLGNWELGVVMPAFGVKTYAVGRRQSNYMFDNMLRREREQFGCEIIDKGQGARKYLQAFKKDKAALGLISDQSGEDMLMNFFSQPTDAPAGAAVLSRTFGAPILVTVIFRDEHNVNHIRFEKEIAVVDAMTEEESNHKTIELLYREFERIIRKYPEQYYWVHNRFKGQGDRA